MDSLKDLQNKFINCVINNDDTIENSISYLNDISPQARMEIYRNNSQAALIKSMELTYPVIEKLVGKDFFTGLCIEFLKKSYPITGNLDDFGGGFSDFITQFPPAQQLTYLSDIAMLEWLFHESCIAHKCQIIDQSAIANIPQDKYFNLHLTLNSSVRFMQSKFPISKIWQVNQDTYTDETRINLDEESGESLMTIRHNMQVNIIKLVASEYCFLNQLAQNNNFYAAFEATLDVDENFDLSFYLQKHLANGTFSGFNV